MLFLDTYAINVIEFLPEEISGALEYPFKNREKWPEKYRKGHEYLEANNKYCLKALKDQGFMKYGRRHRRLKVHDYFLLPLCKSSYFRSFFGGN